MGSINRWLKSLLLACAAIALLVQPAPVKADDPPAPYEWWNNGTWVMNGFTATMAENLIGVGFYAPDWESGYSYEIGIYHNFTVGSGLSNLAWSTTAPAPVPTSASGYAEIGIPQISLDLGDNYYIALGFTHATEVPYFGLNAESPAGYYTSVAYDPASGGGTWNQAMSGGAPGRWALYALTTPRSVNANIEVTAEAGNWTVVDTFAAPATMNAVVSATDNGPHDVQVTVTGGMDPITVEGVITNNTGSDWLNGYCIQLGYGLGDDFVLATDGLSFATNAPLGLAGGETQAVYPYPVAIGADITASFPINMGDSNVFTIRQFAVPEPGSLGLLAFCGLALLALRRRR